MSEQPHRHCPRCGGMLSWVNALIFRGDGIAQFECWDCNGVYFWDARTMEGRQKGLQEGKYLPDEPPLHQESQPE